MDYLIVALLSFYFGWLARQVVAIWRLHKFVSQAEEYIEEAEKSDEKIIMVSIEKHNDQFLVYDENSKFLVQGINRKDIEDKLVSMFPGKNFGCKKENLKEVGFIS